MKKTWIVTPLLVLALAGGSYGIYLYVQPQPLPDGILYGNGHIEGTEVKIGAEVAGRVVENKLVEGEEIANDSLLIRIDDSDLRTRLAQAKAEATALEEEKSRFEEEIRAARHHVETAQSDLARYRELKSKGTISLQRLDQAENAFEEANARRTSFEARLTETAARIDAARQGIRLIQSQLDKSAIHAPLNATVLIKAVEEGEYVAPGQTVAVLVDLSRLEITVFIPERDIGKVRLGNAARARIDAFSERYFDATVTRVDQRAQFTPREVHMPEERVRMVFGVTLSLANLDGVLKPGMPADAWILWKDTVPWPERLVVPK
jgi:HlyD family secretion protein